VVQLHVSSVAQVHGATQEYRLVIKCTAVQDATLHFNGRLARNTAQVPHIVLKAKIAASAWQTEPANPRKNEQQATLLTLTLED
jgi:hypothetical protein